MISDNNYNESIADIFYQQTSFISAIFYKIFTKKVYISNVIILKNEQICSKMIFFKESSKIILKEYGKQNVQLQLDVKKSRSINFYTFETIFFAHNFRTKSK